MSRARRRTGFVLPAACVLLAASFVPFLWPVTSEPATADAVFVLSGDHGERLPIAMRLIDRGVVPTLVFVGTPDRAIEDQLCAGLADEQGFEAICLRPDPDNTRAEARAAARLAWDRGWRSVVVVTSTHHVTRSRLLFGRCFDGRVAVLGGSPPYGWRVAVGAVFHEWLGSLHVLTLARDC